MKGSLRGLAKRRVAPRQSAPRRPSRGTGKGRRGNTRHEWSTTTGRRRDVRGLSPSLDPWTRATKLVAACLTRSQNGRSSGGTRVLRRPSTHYERPRDFTVLVGRKLDRQERLRASSRAGPTLNDPPRPEGPKWVDAAGPGGCARRRRVVRHTRLALSPPLAARTSTVHDARSLISRPEVGKLT
jgi:hypothetical protein